jgi:hypothetical protein
VAKELNLKKNFKIGDIVKITNQWSTFDEAIVEITRLDNIFLIEFRVLNNPKYKTIQQYFVDLRCIEHLTEAEILLYTNL